MENVVSFFNASFRSFSNYLRPTFTSMSMAMFVYVSIRIIVDGLEEFLIMPTAWFYIEQLGQTHSFLGLTLAAYSIGSLLTGPFIGAIDDRFRITKIILVLGAVFKFLGHLIYAIPYNAYFALCGRLISGFAGGTIGVLYGMISRYSAKEGRAKAFLYSGALFNIGTALAPSLGNILTFDFSIFGWKIGPGNSPGLVLTITWFFLLIASFKCIPSNAGHDNFSSSEEIKMGSNEDEENEDELNENGEHLFNFKIACLYYLIFMMFFLYCIVGFYLPLLAVHLYHLKLVHVQMLFVNGTLIVFVGYCSNYLALGYVLERKLMIFWMSLQAIPILLLFYFDFSWHNPDQVIGPYLLLLLIMLGLPCFSYSIILALLSKVTMPQHGAFYLSLASTVAHVSIISSRVIGGLSFSATSMMYTVIGVAFLWLGQILWYSTQYKNLSTAAKN